MNNLDKKIKEFDEKTDLRLQEPMSTIAAKSKALSKSLQRCFDEARASERFQYAYQEGLSRKHIDLEKEELLKTLTSPFEEQDFETFREFVRLLRACTLHIGGDVSKEIRECYNKSFKEDRVLLCYKTGLEEVETQNQKS